MKCTILFSFLLLFMSLAFADDSALSQYFNDTVSYIENQGRDFVSATGAAGGAVGGLPSTLYGAFQPASCGDAWVTGGPAAISSLLSLWFVPIIMTGFLVIIGIAIVYMVGQLFSSPSLIALAKDELFQTGLTFFRVMFIIVALLTTETWYSLSAPSSDPIYDMTKNPYMIDAAMAFARQMVSDMVTQYSMLIMYNMIIHTIYSSTMWFGVTWRAMYSFNLGPVLKPLIDVVGTNLQFLSLGMSEWLLHIVTLCLIKKYMWGLFIPLGMLLRALPYTRSAGEAILALAFALVLFYPFMFLVSYEVHKMMKYNIVDAKGAMSGFIHKGGMLNVFGSVLIVMLLMGGVFIPFFLGGAITLAFELVKGAVYYIVIMSLLLPFVNIFVTLTAAKEIAKFFNVDVNFMAFLKII